MCSERESCENESGREGVSAEISREERERRAGKEKYKGKERENKREKYMESVFVIYIKCDI